MKKIIQWFKSSPDSELIFNDQTITQRRLYKRYQWQVFLSLIIAYSFFYVCRLSLSVVKKPLLDQGILTKEQLGLMGSGLFFAYAFGKFINGFLSDFANIRKFMFVGLLTSAMINFFLGFTSWAWLFILLWTINGWAQSIGSAPSCVSIFQWFSPKQRGSRYSIWAGSHNIGEGLTFIVTSMVVANWGWREGFSIAGISGVIVAILFFKFMKDRPQTLGLPDPATAFGEKVEVKTHSSIWKSQLYVLKSPIVWLIALSCAMMYVSRYAINSWAILYLQEVKKYSLEEAGFAMAAYPVMGLLGAVFSGVISDKFFNSHRPLPATIYGLCNVGGMALLFWGPHHKFVDSIALGIFGFGIGGLIVFLAGLMAADLMPKKAVGAVKGFIGLFSYLAASFQEIISSHLIKIQEVEGVKVYNFFQAEIFWISCGVISIMLVLLVWWMNPEPIS